MKINQTHTEKFRQKPTESPNDQTGEGWPKVGRKPTLGYQVTI